MTTIPEPLRTDPLAQRESEARDALADLVQIARRLGARATANILNRARTRLIEDGANYLDAAEAFVIAGRRDLAGDR